jgi:hypothetical protein
MNKISKIQIKESKTADTRTCDVSQVTKDTLLASSIQHIEDVRKGFDFIIHMLEEARYLHDFTKITNIDEFYSDFKTKFATQDWYTMHKQVERHHISAPDGVRPNVNIIDLLEFIIDGVMAGMARSGAYRKEEISNELLRKCFDNTVDLILNQVEVVK